MLRATTDGFLALSNHFILGGRFATVPNIVPKISGCRDILKEQLLALELARKGQTVHGTNSIAYLEASGGYEHCIHRTLTQIPT